MFKFTPKQKEAIRNLRPGKILVGNTGSGKSITSLGFYFTFNGGDIDKFEKEQYPKMNKNPKDLYIITTARKRDSHEWEMELARFLMSTNKDINIFNNKICIDSWNNISKYKDIENSFFIFDEQRVVGSGEWVKSFLKIAKKNIWILLSATPGDNWIDYVPVFIANGFYKSRGEFCRRHVVYNPFIRNFPKIEKYLEVGHLLKLKKEVTVQMSDIRKTIRHNKNIIVQYDKKLFEEVLKKRWNPFENLPIKNVSEYCSLLRKINNSDPSRLIAVEKILEDNNKVIIFYNFDYELEMLRTLSRYTNVAEWNGHKHQEIPKKKKWVYLVQYAAGAEAWNCIETNVIIFFSQTYSYKLLTQASGRIDRINTPFTDLYYYHLKTTSQIDNAITKSLSMKKDFNENNFFKDKFVA